MDVMDDLRAQVEMMVLDANGRDGLSTCVLRVSNPFGPGDDCFVPFLIAKAKSAWAKFIIGSGKNLCNFTYVENVAHANICAEQVLCSEAASVAGKPFFITDHEKVKFWDFNSNILEGLGYQRPKIHLPAKLVLLLIVLVKGAGQKSLSRSYSPLLTPAMVHVVSCTKTFDSSKAQRLIGYSPVTSLEDGISVTVESFSQLANGLPYLRQKDFSQPSKAELLLGSGKVADILLWRDEKRTFTCLLGLFLLFHWFLLSGRTFISSTAKLLLLLSSILFSHGVLPCSMFGFSIEKMPSSYFEVSESVVRHSLNTIASIWNNGLSLLKSVSEGGNWNIFIKVIGSLYLVKLLLPFSFSVLIAIGVICLFSFFIIYEQCEEEVEKLVTISASGLKKSKEFLSTKLSSFLATYVHKSEKVQ
ncbi:uncharacterized protein A4U43_C04F19100 [Asparagus officinalis]|uniref:Reticulon-like protein n=2 Tax=Asparagus officinalis TaxID=4686 RepID=A0A5P1F4R8_ASPOF|nr:uncharacterized protein A4U43_C04F19100 [Asparagus officinalis]